MTPSRVSLAVLALLGLFNLGPFDSLAQRIDVDLRDMRAVGRDWRVLARLRPLP